MRLAVDLDPPHAAFDGERRAVLAAMDRLEKASRALPGPDSLEVAGDFVPRSGRANIRDGQAQHLPLVQP